MKKKIWGRPLHTRSLPVLGSVSSAAVLVGSIILYVRRRRAQGIEIKIGSDATSSVVNELNSPEVAHMLLLIGTQYPKTLEMISQGEAPYFDEREINRGIRRSNRETRRMLLGKRTAQFSGLTLKLAKSISRRR